MSQKTSILVLLATGCFHDVWVDGAERFPDEPAGEASSTTTTGAGADAGGSVHTATGPEPVTTGALTTGELSTTRSSSTAAVDPDAPAIELLVTPATLIEAGSAEVSAAASADVVELELEVDGEVVWQGPPASFAWTFWATSAEASDGEHHFALTARNAEGLEASDGATLTVTLPPSGQERCSYVGQDLGWIAGAVYEADALVLVGARSAPDLEATVWRLDPDTCGAMAGWPWSLSSWTTLPIAPPSQAVGVAVDDTGRVVLAANLGSGLQRRGYVAVLKPSGALAWERMAPVGSTYSGVAAGGGRVVVVGEQLVGEAPLRYDGLVDGFDEESGVKLWSRVLRAPDFGDLDVDEFNDRNEHPRAVLWDSTAEAFVLAGERNTYNPKAGHPTHSFIARYSAHGVLLNTWTSNETDASHDGLTSLAPCGSGLVASGWAKDLNNVFPATRWLDESGAGDQRRFDPLIGTTTHGLGCDREQKVTSAATRSADVMGHLFAYRTAEAPMAFAHTFTSSPLTAAACDPRGFCVVAGSKNSKPWARVHHP